MNAPRVPRRVLVVDDDPTMRALVARHVRRRMPDATVMEAGSAEEALRLVDGDGADLTVVADLNLGAGMDGGGLLKVVRERHPGARRVLLTGAPDARADADAVVTKGIAFPGLLESL